MLSWFGNSARSGANVDTAPQELEFEAELDAPETPAPVFAVRAFKYALFGTPKPNADDQSRRITEDKPAQLTEEDLAGPAALRRIQSGDASLARPNSILMTPGMGTSRKKSVSFPAHVVDNEGKTTSFTARLATPKAVPGKFPSPFTPRVRPETLPAKEQKPDIAATPPTTNLPPATLQVEPSPTARRAKDDVDLTIDISEPRSESGRYWKEQYVSYAAKSEKEMKRLVAKHQMAKSYAKRKDEEAMELTSRLTESNRDHRIKEREMSEQMKDLKRQLLKAHDQITRLTGEMSILKRRLVESREPTTPPQSSDVWLGQDSATKPSRTAISGDGNRDSSKPVPTRGQSRQAAASAAIRVSRKVLCPRDTNISSPADRKGHVDQGSPIMLGAKPSQQPAREQKDGSFSAFDFDSNSENRPPMKPTILGGELPSASPSGLKGTPIDWEPSQIARMESEMNTSRMSRLGVSRTPLPQEKSAAARARIKARREANAARRKMA